MTRILVIYHSLYGHVEKLADAVAAGAREVEQCEVALHSVPETMSEQQLKKAGAISPKASILQPQQLADYDAIIFGTPTRFGNMSGQMRTFLDQTGGLWASDALVGKVGSVFTSSNTQHGGQESTILSFHTTLLHLGMVVVGVPYSCKALLATDEICGGSPYGASTIAGSDGKRQPTQRELTIAEFQGRHVAQIAKKLRKKPE